MQELSSAQPLQVLSIEDSSADARLIRALLADAEAHDVAFAVDWATDLDGACRALAGRRFDAVLLDLLLPDARGTDLIETIRAAAPHAALIVTSGQAADDYLLAQAIIRRGAEDFLPKQGLTATLLARTLTTAVERRRTTAAIGARTAQLEAALLDARIAHLSWVPDDREAVLAGDLARLLGLQLSSSRASMRRLLRQLSPAMRQGLYAAWRELHLGPDRLAVVLVDTSRSSTGNGHDLLLEAAVQRDATGAIVRLDALVRDTTMIGHIERLEGDLITHLGHELRTPLTAIRGALGLLAHDEPSLTGEARSLVENAVANAERIVRVIGDTLGANADRPSSLRARTRRVAIGPHLYDALAARLPSQEAPATGPKLTLTSGSRALDVMVDAARLRRAVDYLFARLEGCAERRDRLALDVSLRGAVAWLELVAPEGADNAPGTVRRRMPEGAGTVPAPAKLCSGPAGLCIAVPLAA